MLIYRNTSQYSLILPNFKTRGRENYLFGRMIWNVGESNVHFQKVFELDLNLEFIMLVINYFM